MSAAADLPWLAPLLRQAQGTHAHALLLHGAAGDGLFEAAQAITQAWLCESTAPVAMRPCGQCASCHLASGGLHPDLQRLMPEELRVQLGVQQMAEGEGGDGDGGGKSKRKPSRQIRIDEVRAAIDWVATTSSRGRAKVVLIHPAEAMNIQSANALLKTLEEPPLGARLLLTAAEPERLLPTVRSRCQLLRLKPPTAEAAHQWLQQQGLAQPEVLLAACSGRPLEALAMSAAGVDGDRWAGVPSAVLQRQAAWVSGWSLPRLLDALQKLCHDGLALLAGGAPRFYPAASLKRPADAMALAAWSRDLTQLARRIDHPWNEGLLVDALLQRAQAAWEGRRGSSDTLVP